MKRGSRPATKLDKAIYAALSERFRGGYIYAYALEGNTWTTWATEADWLATERNGSARVPDAERGPCDWNTTDLAARLGVLTPPKRVTPSDIIAKLRTMADILPAEARQVLGV